MKPNAALHLPLETGARDERRLEAVRCKRLLASETRCGEPSRCPSAAERPDDLSHTVRLFGHGHMPHPRHEFYPHVWQPRGQDLRIGAWDDGVRCPMDDQRWLLDRRESVIRIKLL